MRSHEASRGARCEVRFASKLNPGDLNAKRRQRPIRNRITSARNHHPGAESPGRTLPSNDRNRRWQLKHVASFRETNEAKIARCEINRLPALASLRGALPEHATQI